MAALSEADRARFVAAFERLSVMTYASRFKTVTADTFKAAEPTRGGGSRAGHGRDRPSERRDVTLEYLLQRRGGEWKIINIIADGVSDLALKRAEYQRMLARGAHRRSDSPHRRAGFGARVESER